MVRRMADALESRVRSPRLLRKLMPPEAAATLIDPGATLAVSGFTKSGEPKVMLPALARRLEAEGAEAGLTLFSGASLSDEVESPISPFVVRRGPYMSNAVTRRRILEHKAEYADVHLSMFARDFGSGVHGPTDVAIVEVSRIREDDSVALTSSVGISAEALDRAHAIILEVNTAEPDYSGFHDVVLPPRPPHTAWPVPITDVGDRAGFPYFEVDPERVVAVVESRQPDHGVVFKGTQEVHRKIADNVVAYLIELRDRLGWGDWVPPLQSGVGNVANAVIGALYDSPFQKMRFWTEVFQDGMLRYVEDRDKFEGATATALSFSEEAERRFLSMIDRCRDTVVLRPMWISNGAELISRLFVVAMNTPLEIDIYGHVNSTHIRGSRIVNGLGGSGDFFRNAYVSIVHTPSVRRLRDGRTVSCVMPYLDHVDHTEHDIKCVVTEQGYADIGAIRSGWHKANDIIETCAHPHFRPLLRDYIKMSGGGDEPHATRLDRLEGWWRDYDAACRSFPAAGT